MGITARPLIERLQTKYRINPKTGCWEWTASIKRNGYGQIGVRQPKPTMLDAHRASWMVHKGPIPKGMRVLHHCDVKACVNPEHLFLGTQADNVRDMIAKGRANNATRHRGEAHYAAKLTWEQVRAIRADTRTQVVIAAEYGVRQSYISNIKLYRKWRNDST